MYLPWMITTSPITYARAKQRSCVMLAVKLEQILIYMLVVRVSARACVLFGPI